MHGTFTQSPFLPANRIDSRAWDFLALCSENGLDARLVGGCVRDALLASMGRHGSIDRPDVSTDIDIAIACPPWDVISFCKKHRLKCIPTGLAHGTVTIVYHGLVLEVTSLRADVKTHGRHATVAFGTSFAADAKRRDFTMNALYVDQHRVLYDAFDGASDVATVSDLAGASDVSHGRVRFIGDPAARIAEDYLRLYRYFRFWGRFCRGPVDLSVLPPLISIKDQLSQLSIERVQSELFKLLMQPWPGPVLESMRRYGLLAHVFGDVVAGVETGVETGVNHDVEIGIKTLRRLTVLEAMGGHSICQIRRLCALTHVGNARGGNTHSGNLRGENAPDPFKLSRVQTQKRNHCLLYLSPKKSPKALAAMHPESWHPQWWVDVHLLRDAASCKPLWRCISAAKLLSPPPPFPLTGADVVALGVPPGPRVGAILTAVKRHWIDDDFECDHAACVFKATLLV